MPIIINSIRFFSSPPLRNYTRTIPSRIGFIKLPDIQGCQPHLKNKNTIIFAKNNLFYADLKKKVLLMIHVNAINPTDYMQLKKQCGDTWRTATPSERELIQRVLKDNDQYHSRQQARQQQDAYTSAEERDKEFWRTLYFAGAIDDGGHPRPNQHAVSNQTTNEQDYSSQTEKYDYSPNQQNADDSSVMGEVADAVGNVVDAVSDIFSGPD